MAPWGGGTLAQWHSQWWHTGVVELLAVAPWGGGTPDKVTAGWWYTQRCHLRVMAQAVLSPWGGGTRCWGVAEGTGGLGGGRGTWGQKRQEGRGGC